MRRGAGRGRPRRIGQDRAGRNDCSVWCRPTAARCCFAARRFASSRRLQAIQHGIGYVPEDRRQHGVVLEMPVASNASLASLAAVSSYGIDRPRRRVSFGRELRRAPAHQDAIGVDRGRSALRRESAEGRAGAVVVDRPAGPDPGRADPGRRCRRESGNPRADPGSRRARARDHHDLVGAAGDPGHERPCGGDARRHRQRCVVSIRSDAGQDPGAGALRDAPRSGAGPDDVHLARGKNHDVH